MEDFLPPAARQTVTGVVAAGWTLGKQTATLFLGAVAFAVAMSWNNTVQSAIRYWSPKDDTDTRAKALRFNALVTLGLTVAAVFVAAVLTAVYGKSIRQGQATSYGLG